MQEGRLRFRDLFWVAAGQWHYEYKRSRGAVRLAAADAQHLTIKRDHVIVVDLVYRACIQLLRGAAFYRNSVEGAAFIKQQLLSIGHIIWRFKSSRRFMNYLPVVVGKIQDLEPAAPLICFVVA